MLPVPSLGEACRAQRIEVRFTCSLVVVSSNAVKIGVVNVLLLPVCCAHACPWK